MCLLSAHPHYNVVVTSSLKPCILVVDHYDSYTPILIDTCHKLLPDAQITWIQHDAAQLPNLAAFTGIIIGPGPGHPTDPQAAGPWLPELLASKLPILGVCFGAQQLALAAGAQLTRVADPAHGEPILLSHAATGITTGLPNPFQAMHYNSLGIKRAENLPLVDFSPSSSFLEWFAWPEANAFGLQFHPESVGTPAGELLLANIFTSWGLKIAAPPATSQQELPAQAAKPDTATKSVSPAVFEQVLQLIATAAARYTACACTFFDGHVLLVAANETVALTQIPAAGAIWLSPYDPSQDGFTLTKPPQGSCAIPIAELAIRFQPHTASWEFFDPETCSWLQGLGPYESWLAAPPVKLPPAPELVFTAADSLTSYTNKIRACQDLIATGETYELCLTTSFTAQGVSADVPTVLSLFQKLTAFEPAPMAALWLTKSQAILVNSPERFIKIAHGTAATCPIKGTLPRTGSKDEAERNLLARSQKDLREHMMIVDVLRGDLAKTAQPGSITTPRLAAIYSFTYVHQMISTITAQLADPTDAAAALTAVLQALPPGSMTGAPKKRSMQLLELLEANPRGAYAGIIGTINGDQAEVAVDSAVLIRSLTLDFTTATAAYGVGGAIIATSDPAAEFAELKTKAIPLTRLGQVDFPPASSYTSIGIPATAELPPLAAHVERLKAAAPELPLPELTLKLQNALLAARPAPAAAGFPAVTFAGDTKTLAVSWRPPRPQPQDLTLFAPELLLDQRQLPLTKKPDEWLAQKLQQTRAAGFLDRMLVDYDQQIVDCLTMSIVVQTGPKHLCYSVHPWTLRSTTAANLLHQLAQQGWELEPLARGLSPQLVTANVAVALNTNVGAVPVLFATTPLHLRQQATKLAATFTQLVRDQG